MTTSLGYCTRTITLGLAVAATLSACAQSPTRDADLFAGEPEDRQAVTGVTDSSSTLQLALDAVASGNWSRAQVAFADSLRDDVRNPQLQFLNGLAYERMARAGDRAKLDLARVGYENATRFDAGSYWAHLHLGYLELDAGNYAAAQESFAKAVQDQPGRWEASYGLGVASYYSGDAAMARLAAERLRQIDPANPGTLRLLAYAMAMVGDPAALEAAQQLKSADPADTISARRVAEVLRGATLAQASMDGTSEAVPMDPNFAMPVDAAPDEGGQLVIDVTIILSSQVKTENRGINLFDGLSLQYGMTNVYTSNRSSGQDPTSSRSITSTIAIPQLTYSLNLFNDTGQTYQVLARPSLNAYLGRESEFFAGRTITVGVSGVNLGTLQPIDVGVGLKVTPERIDGNRVKFQVHANRSFLSREQVGTFQEALTTFKQLVNATAEVEFGQTLLLSALSEKVRDATFSKTPGLGDIPGVSALFNDRTALNRTESLLVLVTPLRTTTIATRDREPANTVERLRKGWSSWIDPSSSLEAVLSRLEAQRFFGKPEVGDVRWRSALTPELLQEALAENIQLARR
jgi:tetratricopeptide (TPR) repeat protein